MQFKYFTPQEANRRLPYVRKIVAEILTKGARVKDILVLSSQAPEIQQEYRCLEAEIQGLMKELEALGCFFKDWNFEIGLVDFPAIIHGKEVLLCWRSDEPQVAWFHGFEDGFSGRMPLTKDLIIS